MLAVENSVRYANHSEPEPGGNKMTLYTVLVMIDYGNGNILKKLFLVQELNPKDAVNKVLALPMSNSTALTLTIECRTTFSDIKKPVFLGHMASVPVRE
jgi:hypothetical protein